ncbi:hypothetical protein [Streptomyces nitrosporeus]|uniref:hypothetical protein n=1 Tax=Streptomyces nitrosporeus TaxID=28894 RepID=UPI0039A00E38
MRRLSTAGRTRPRTILTGITALLLLLVSLLTAEPVSARGNGLLDVTCTAPSSSSVTYSPPLTNTPQASSAMTSWQLGPCLSASVPALTSGSHFAVSAPFDRSCLALLDANAITRTITWNTGATSTLSMNRTTTVVGAVLTVTYAGTVSSGLFSGDTVLIIVTYPATDITLCTLGLGTVANLFGVVTLEITSV